MHDEDGDDTPRGLLNRISMTLQAAWRTDAAWLRLLLPLSLLHRVVLYLRRQLFRRGWRATYRSPVPVVVVGNITVGGTGKTPVVSALAAAMRARGLRVGIVSRGYGARPGGFPRRVLPDSHWRDCGDEPLMIARQTACPLVIAPRRADAVRELLQWQTPDLVISDDGLQHLALERDFEIVLLDAAMGIGNGRLLPAGPLREPPARLEGCDWILQRDSAVPARHFRYQIDGLVNIRTGETREANTLAGQRVQAIAGIANPEAFFASLRGLGMQVCERPYPDHYAFVATDFSGLQGLPIIMTEKDAVKCEEFVESNAWFLKITAVLPQELLEQVARLANLPTAQE